MERNGELSKKSNGELSISFRCSPIPWSYSGSSMVFQVVAPGGGHDLVHAFDKVLLGPCETTSLRRFISLQVLVPF